MAKMPTMLGEAADLHYKGQAALAMETSALVQRVWYSMEGSNFPEKVDWFRSIGLPSIARLVRNGQFQSLTRTQQYMTVVAAIQDVKDQSVIDPSAFIFEQDAIETALDSSMFLHIGNTMSGVPEAVSMRMVGYALTRDTASAVQDAGRDAVSATILTSNYYGYVRKLQLPSCKRCAVLAGKEFRTNDGFDRHDLCDCLHVPISESYDDATTDPVQAIADGNVTGLSKADTEAILEHDADVSQVINASQGLTTETLFGQKVKATTTGTTVRGVAGQRLGDLQKRGGRYRQTGNTRLSVGQIMKFAKDDPEMAKSLLYRHGYVL